MFNQRSIPARWFLYPSLAVLVAALGLMLLFPRAQIHMAFNSLHTPWLDTLFRMWTFLGDGVVALAIVLVPLMIRIRYSLVMFAGYAISGLSAQLIKRLFSGASARPLKFFELNYPDHELYLVPGVDLHTWFSFPSGHTATAFGVFFSLALLARNGAVQFAAFLVAVGVAYSRIYLSQHFLADVTGGAALGMAGGFLGWWWIGRYDRPWMNRSLPKLLMHEKH